MIAPKIMVVEDEEPLCVLLRYNLEAEGYQVEVVTRGDEAELRLQENVPDLLVLDWMVPAVSGIELCRRLRMRPETERLPIIMLTARGEESDRVRGLSTGADDYLVKPFDLDELSARIGSVARRYSGNPNPIIRHRALDIDIARRSVRRDGRPVQLTAREWALLESFLARPGQLLSKAQLEEKLYDFDAEIESNTIEVHVSRLRKKLGTDLIETERGLGYRLAQA